MIASVVLLLPACSAVATIEGELPGGDAFGTVQSGFWYESTWCGEESCGESYQAEILLSTADGGCERYTDYMSGWAAANARYDNLEYSELELAEALDANVRAYMPERYNELTMSLSAPTAEEMDGGTFTYQAYETRALAAEVEVHTTWPDWVTLLTDDSVDNTEVDGEDAYWGQEGSTLTLEALDGDDGAAGQAALDVAENKNSRAFHLDVSFTVEACTSYGEALAAL